jgi:hypothetical protein
VCLGVQRQRRQALHAFALLLSKLVGLPAECKAAFLAGAIASDGHQRATGFYNITQAPLAHKGTDGAEWRCHASVLGAFATVATSIGVSRGIRWSRNHGHGVELTTVQGLLSEPIRKHLEAIMPRKAKVDQGRLRSETVAGLREVSAVRPELGSSEECILVVALDRDESPLDFVAGPGHFVLVGGHDRGADALLAQSGWGPEALSVINRKSGFNTREEALGAYSAAENAKNMLAGKESMMPRLRVQRKILSLR